MSKVDENVSVDNDNDNDACTTSASADQMGGWLAVFMSQRFSKGQPDLSVYARVISRLAIRQDRRIPAMAVTLENSRVVLLYNDVWLAKAGFVEFTSTLAHEATHVLNNDIPRFLRALSASNTKTTHHLLNIAMDAANNSLTSKRHKDIAYGTTGYWVMPENLGLPPDNTTEIYFEALSLKKEEIKKYLESIKSSRGGTAPDEDDTNEEGTPSGASGEQHDDECDNEGGDRDDEGEEGDGKKEHQEDGEDGNGGEEDTQDEVKADPTATDIARNAAMAEMLGEELKAAIDHMLSSNAHPWLQSGQTPEDAAAMADMVQEQTGEVVKKALEEQKAIGNLPAHLQQKLAELYEESKISWQEILRRQVTPRILSKRKATMVRPSKRRYTMFEEDEDGVLQPLPSPIPQYPGGKRSRTFHIMFAIDVSGSMSASEIMEGLSEMKAITDAFPDTKCTVLQVDTHISNVTIIDSEFNVDAYVRSIGRTACGGTAFDQPFLLAQFMAGRREWPASINKRWMTSLLPHPADFVIYHTDTFGAWPDRSLNPGVPVTWLVPKVYGAHANKTPTFGSVLIREA